MFQTFYDWFQKLFDGGGQAVSWLITPINIGDFSIAPLFLLTLGGLIVFIGVALIKWFIS